MCLANQMLSSNVGLGYWSVKSNKEHDNAANAGFNSSII